MSLKGEVARCRRRASKPPSVRELRANFRGVFWLPCPVCGEHFSGDELIGQIAQLKEMLPPNARVTKGICSQCELDNGVSYMLEHLELDHQVVTQMATEVGGLDTVWCLTCRPPKEGGCYVEEI